MPRQPNAREEQDAEKRRQALRDIERVNSEAEIVGTSAMHRKVDSLQDGNPPGGIEVDPMEILGKRIARILSITVIIGLIVYLMKTYVL